MKIRCYPVDVTYKVVNGKAVVMLYCRAEDGNQVCVADPSFRPYFYVLPAKADEARRELEQCRLEFDGDIYTVTGIETVTKKVREHETQCLRVYANLPSGIPHIREFAKNLPSVKDTFEYDIKYGRRYLMDKSITPFTLIEAEGEQQEKSKVQVFVASSVAPAGEETLKPKVLALDIEVYNQRGDYPSPEKDPIVMAALYGESFVRLATWKEFRGAPDGTMVVKDEADLIRQLQAWIEEYQPDILAGYYSDGFDLPYIK
ncbi:hypothetical protein HY642_07020, partial [Candidatus Woesearchaeota archaeon]|nr:hypothetical protein [Candidatus Woesearchaeota archaeon]